MFQQGLAQSEFFSLDGGEPKPRQNNKKKYFDLFSVHLVEII